MSKNLMVVRLNLPTVLGALALMSATGCGSDDDLGLEARAQIDTAIDGSVDCAPSAIDGGAAVDAGGPVGIDAGLAATRIVGVTAFGSACPNADSYTATIAPDGQSVTVELNEFVSEVSSESTLSNKFCQLAVDVTSEGGAQYKLSRSSVRGQVALDEGVTGFIEVRSYFQGNATPGDTWRTDLNGPNDGEELVLDAPEPTITWSPCGLDRDVNVRFTSQVSNVAARNRNGYLRLERVQVFDLTSRSCP